MKDWFANLEQREQWIVGVGGIVVAIIVLWGFIWTPLDKGHRNLEANVADWQRALTEIRGIAAQGSQTGSTLQGPSIDTNQTPVIIVDQTLRERGLTNAVQRQQPTPNGINVVFEDVPFDQLVVWLGDLYVNYGLAVQNGSLTLASRSEPGLINARLTLERAP